MKAKHYEDEAARKITFFSKNALQCPVCMTRFHREEMHSGGGRLSAGRLKDDLRRMYEPSKKYGELTPLIYVILTCPSCYFSSLPEDFNQVSQQSKQVLEGETGARRNTAFLIFDAIDFSQPRGLSEGISSYLFAIMTYEHFEKRFSPTIKRGICSLRAAWLCDDMHRKFPGENYDLVSEIFYKKARFYYKTAIDREQKGEELLTGVKNMGPDIDKNYGYEGLLYLAGLLDYIYGPKKDVQKRIEHLVTIKRTISKIHGVGKASKDKPSTILEKAKALYDNVSQELKSLQAETAGIEEG
jgi:uncharacterized protein (DUF2225 family)